MADFTLYMSDGAQLYAKLIGGDDVSKPLLIALHGAPGLSTHAEPGAAFGFLSDRYRVLVFDARGSGRSSLQPPYTHAQWVSDIEELRVHVGADKIILAGGSYGGAVALEYALAHPNRILALVLRGTFARGVPLMMYALKSSLRSDSLRKETDPELQLRLWTGTLKDDTDFKRGVAEIQGLFATPWVDDVSDKVIEEEESIDQAYSETQNAAFGDNLPKYDVLRRLGEIKVPTLVTVGRFDLVAPVRSSKEIADAIPGANLVVFEKSGHQVPVDEREKFQEVVQGFLEEFVLASSPSFHRSVRLS